MLRVAVVVKNNYISYISYISHISTLGGPPDASVEKLDGIMGAPSEILQYYRVSGSPLGF